MLKNEKENKIIMEDKIVSITPEDGWVHDRDVSEIGEYGKYHYGRQVRYQATIGDSRIVKKIVYLFSGIWIFAGLITLIWDWRICLLLVSIGVFCYFVCMKGVNKRQEELELKGCDVTLDTPEERKEFEETLKRKKEEISERFSNELGEEPYKWFVRISMPWVIGFSVIALLITFFVSLYLVELTLINALLAVLVVFLVLTLFMFLFYGFVKVVFSFVRK